MFSTYIQLPRDLTARLGEERRRRERASLDPARQVPILLFTLYSLV